MVFHTENETPAQLWIISALVASKWSQNTFFIVGKVPTSICERVWPNFDQINTTRLDAIFSMIVETRRKSSKRWTPENYSRSIEMLLTLNRLHFSWSYWLPKFLLLPYTCDGIKDAVLTASTKTGSFDNATRKFSLAKPSWYMSHYTMIAKNSERMRDFLGLSLFIVSLVFYILGAFLIKQLFHSRLLDMRWL